MCAGEMLAESWDFGIDITVPGVHQSGATKASKIFLVPAISVECKAAANGVSLCFGSIQFGVTSGWLFGRCALAIIANWAVLLSVAMKLGTKLWSGRWKNLLMSHALIQQWCQGLWINYFAVSNRNWNYRSCSAYFTVEFLFPWIYSHRLYLAEALSDISVILMCMSYRVY